MSLTTAELDDLFDAGWCYQPPDDRFPNPTHGFTRKSPRTEEFTAVVSMSADTGRVGFHVTDWGGRSVTTKLNLLINAPSLADAIARAWADALRVEISAEWHELRRGNLGGPFGEHRRRWLARRHPRVALEPAVRIPFQLQLMHYRERWTIKQARDIIGPDADTRHLSLGLRAARDYLCDELGHVAVPDDVIRYCDCDH